MQRSPRSLTDTEFDLVVVGGGVYGAFAALSAARCGLATALIEGVDFGHATSANSLRTVHGGLRYLQHFDLKRMRESSVERRALMRMAPDLIDPMPFVMPTFGHGMRGPEALRVALAINDAVAFDRNAGLAPGSQLPRGRVASRTETRKLLGAVELDGYNGGAIWYDGFNHDPERLILRIVQRAAELGAQVVNHVRVDRLTIHDGRVVGVVARDEIEGRDLEVRCRFVLNAAGPWIDAVAGGRGRLFAPSLAVNLVVNRVDLGLAVGIPVGRRSRDRDAVIDSGQKTLFVLPWGRWSLVGTYHMSYTGDLLEPPPRSVAVNRLLDEIGPAARRIGVREENIVAVLSGYLPARPARGPDDEVELIKHPVVVDHERRGGPAGLMSVIGVKWTTSRLVADRAVRAVCEGLGRRLAPSIPSLGFLPDRAENGAVGGTVAVQDPRMETFIRRAVRDEMAVRLDDLVRRRTKLWLNDALDDALLEWCGNIMGTELEWTADTIAREVAFTKKMIAAMRDGSTRKRVR
jgi:glycerol-3-phosphate dehydrogenase